MRFSRLYSSLPSALASILLLCIMAYPQGKNQLAQTSVQPSQVRLNVLVLDSKNHPVPDLRQEDFQVFEGDVAQKITFFSRESLPVIYGLLIDTSNSMRPQLKDAVEAGRTIISNNRVDDESFLVRFSGTDKIEIANDFTTDKATLLDQLKSLQVEAGQTAIIDTLYFSADHLAKYKQEEGTLHQRRALILISDGEDRSGIFHKEELIKLLHDSTIQVFLIGLTKDLDQESGLTRKSPRDKAIALLEELAKETGGRAFFPNSSSDIKDAATEISSYLHTQYTIGYIPADQTSLTPKRKIRIKLADAPGRNKLKIVVGPIYK